MAQCVIRSTAIIELKRYLTLLRGGISISEVCCCCFATLNVTVVVTVKLLFVCIVFCSTNGLVGGTDGFSHRLGGTGARLINDTKNSH